VDKRTVVFPGFDGGAEWGGQAIARGRGILYINANDVAWTGALDQGHRRAGRDDLSAELRGLSWP
jgi:quinoprotein glucose dehydrogenase